jgi:hypothetical protein
MEATEKQMTAGRRKREHVPPASTLMPRTAKFKLCMAASPTSLQYQEEVL